MNIAILFLVAATGMRSDGMLAPGARDVSMRVPRVVSGAASPAPTVTIATTAQTVCSSQTTVTGTATDATSVAWATSPAGGSGACTGTSSWSCLVTSTGGGDQTVTVTATGAGGTGDDDVAITFTPDAPSGAVRFFTGCDVDGGGNATLANNDPVALWHDNGSAGIDPAQGVGSAQPTFKVASDAICDGIERACVTVDGNDFLRDATEHTAQAQPFTMCAVYGHTTNNNVQYVMYGNDTGDRASLGVASTGLIFGNAGATATGTASNNDNWHCGCIYYNGTSTEITIDGTPTTGLNGGTQGTDGLTIFATNSGGNLYINGGRVFTMGVWNSDRRADFSAYCSGLGLGSFPVAF